MPIKKIDYSSPSYSPKRAKDYIKNNNIEIFIPSIIIDEFEKFKKFDELSTKEEKFIFKINNFNNDFKKILRITSDMKGVINSLDSDYSKLLKSIDLVEFDELNSKIKRIFDFAVKYEKNYTIRRFIPKYNGKYFCMNCLFSDYPIRNSDGDSDSFKKYINIVNFLKEYDSFIRNFLNLVYVDGEDAEEFLDVKFSELMVDYMSVVSKIEDLNKVNKLQSFNERLEKLNIFNENIIKVFDDYPATIFKVIFEYYYRSKGVEIKPDQLGFEFGNKDYMDELMIFKV